MKQSEYNFQHLSSLIAFKSGNYLNYESSKILFARTKKTPYKKVIECILYLPETNNAKTAIFCLIRLLQIENKKEINKQKINNILKEIGANIGGK